MPRRVIGSGFDGGAGVGAGSLCGSGASGSPEVALAVAGCWVGFWAETWLVGSRNETVRHSNALNLGGVTGIDKFGRQLTAPLAGGYHRRTAGWGSGTQIGKRVRHETEPLFSAYKPLSSAGYEYAIFFVRLS